jgi:hypothetical protein
MRLHRFSVAAAAAIALSVPAAAAEVRSNPRAVLELFTSQGCSSCPMADAKLTELGQRPDLITLAYHVDYWDYIGWADTFGTAANSNRQRAYAQSWGSSRIYTPELVVNGKGGVVGSRDGDVSTALDGASLALPVTLAIEGDILEVTIGGKPGGRESMVWLVTFKDHATVEIQRGENAGKTMDYTQIVTGRQVLGMWEPESGTHLKLPIKELLKDGATGAAVLVQDETKGLPGPILGASSFQL